MAVLGKQIRVIDVAKPTDLTVPEQETVEQAAPAATEEHTVSV